ncbi:MAG: hypothetical protein A2Z11_01865 [Candidatus Woykebacteria bacterium RBG_16_43_9]|uniref:Uncharacterized protein n=1 Tax=Candidatus Woykebacteria bacterium RBG_16_43_9 TaxID=1802596 RepID=A0A1G1WGS0_9BACT|nr:MAG: hypothetical protein A2Z11_01865 [Candidatus Woykebacteria bacterium RBG_16_43_9]
MKIKFLALLIGVGLAMIFAGHVEAKGLTTSTNSTGADASFFTVIDGLETYTYVSASDFVTKDPYGGSSGSSVWVGIFMVDIGDPENYEDDVFKDFFGYADLGAGDFVVGKGLSSAALQPVDVEVCEAIYYEGPGAPPEPECFDVSVDLVWGSAGDLSKDWGNSHHRDPACSSDSSFSTRYRVAVANGSVTDGERQFTPDPSDYAAVYASSYKDASRGCDFGGDPCTDGFALMDAVKMNGRGRGVTPANIPTAWASAGCSVPTR